MTNVKSRGATICLAILAVAAVLPTKALAYRNYGANCMSCHSVHRDAMAVTAYDELVSLSDRLDGGTADPLPTFAVTPGETVTLSFLVSNGYSRYALALTDLDQGGVRENASNHLIYTADSSWENRSTYFTTPRQTWTGATTHQFELDVHADTPPDFYALFVQIGGGGGGLWAEGEEFYIQVVGNQPTPGDLDCNGDIDFDDIDPFVLALSGQAGYEAAYPDCNWMNADADGSGDVDFDDIDPFVALLSGD